MKAQPLLPFATSEEHLAAEVSWLDDALRALVASAGTSSAEVQSAGHGWFVSAEEVERLLDRKDQLPIPGNVVGALWRKRRSIVRRKQASAKKGVSLALDRVSRVFRLSRGEELLLLACLAADTDVRYARIYGYLHDDLTRSEPSVQLIARLLPLDPSGERPDTLLSPDAPVFSWELVRGGGTRSSLMSRGFLTDPHVVSCLLGHREPDSRIVPFLRSAAADGHAVPAAWLAPLVEQIWNVVDDRHPSTLVLFHGAGSEDGIHVASRLCRKLGIGLLHGDVGRLADLSSGGDLGFDNGILGLFRDALLRGSAIYASGFDRLAGDPRAEAHRRSFEAAAGRFHGLVFVETRSLWMPGAIGAGHTRCMPLEIAAPPFEVRRAVWNASLPGATDASQLDMLAARYRFTAGRIQEVARLAGTHARARGLRTLEAADVLSSCRLSSRVSLDGLAKILVPRAAWEDLVVPADILDQLQEICAHCRHRARVFHQWGFGRTVSAEQGTYGLLVGPSGTGKTLAAEVIAGALNTDLAKVDLSAVVSKYIGETEKNLERVFKAASGSDAVLFFDEADALFGKRSEVRDAHDRYSNIEVSYLLQRLEAHDGIVILASNLAQNMDDAFTRRLHFEVQLPFPDERSRLAIWRRHIPPDAPVSEDLDFAQLACTFKISGGGIRNVALNAAFLAAEAGGAIGMSHVVRALRREFVRMGKPFPASLDAGAREVCA